MANRQPTADELNGIKQLMIQWDALAQRVVNVDEDGAEINVLNPLQAEIQDPNIMQSIRIIENDYGDTVSVVAKKKNLFKFGRNTNVGTSATGYTIWFTGQDQAHETYVAANTNSIDSISSSSGSDNSGVTVTIEGHTETGSAKTFVSQTATLNGNTRVPLTTSLNRCTRVFVNGSQSNVGELYVYENTSLSTGKPSDTTKIHATVPATKNQTEKASTSLSNTDYWIITKFDASLLTKTSNVYAEVEIQVRLNGKVFRPICQPIAVGAGDSREFSFKPYLIVPKNSDVRLVAIGSASCSVSGGMQGYLASVQ